MSNLRDIALNADDITIEQVPVPEWQGAVYGVKSMTIEQQREFLAAISDKDGKVDRAKYAPQMLITSVVDPDNGLPVFEPADAEALVKKSAAAVMRLLPVANRLAGLGEDEEIEEALADLGETPTSASDSG